MPYIKPEQRTKFKEVIDKAIISLMDKDGNWDAGELNFLLFSIAKRLCSPPRYEKFNKLMGVLKCMSDEFYRKVVAPYEDTKTKENGDIE